MQYFGSIKDLAIICFHSYIPNKLTVGDAVWNPFKLRVTSLAGKNVRAISQTYDVGVQEGKKVEEHYEERPHNFTSLQELIGDNSAPRTITKRVSCFKNSKYHVIEQVHFKQVFVFCGLDSGPLRFHAFHSLGNNQYAFFLNKTHTVVLK